MEPLKRFTQCGSLTMLFAVFIVLFGVSSTALTTFGKTNPNNLQQSTPPPAKGRECNTHADCATLQHTSCVKDPGDGKTRCLCGDNVAPINGQCFTYIKGLRHLCSKDTDCEEGMICGVDNATRTTGFSKMINSQSAMKLCLCDEENGWEESLRDYTCNGATVQTFINSFIPLGCVLISYILTQSKNQLNDRHFII